MKKLIALLVTLTLALSLVPITAGAADSIVDNVGGQPIKVSLDGQPINFEYRPLSVNGVIYAPLYALCAALPMGCTVSYDSAAQIATIDAPGVHLGMAVGSNVVAWNYVNENMDSPMLVISDVLYVPVKTIASVFCLMLSADSNVVNLNSSNVYQTIDWNDFRYFIGYKFLSDNMFLSEGTKLYMKGIVYDKATGVPTAYGIFDNGKLRQGAEFWDDGAYYIGEFQNGERNGYGEFHWPDGDYYIGELQNGLSNGQGEYHWPDGTYYIGEFQNDLPNGQGEQYWPDGAYYKGEFQNGERSGKGEYHWPNGGYYIGEWQNDKPNGQGERYWPDGRLYKGEWQNDFPNGQGEYHWSDGAYYIGEWQNGQRNGQGTMHYPDGSEDIGVWADGTYVGP